jgi:hypothetical protein
VTLLHYAMALAQGVGAFVIVNLEPPLRALVFLPFIALNAAYAVWVLRRARRAGLGAELGSG